MNGCLQTSSISNNYQRKSTKWRTQLMTGFYFPLQKKLYFRIYVLLVCMHGEAKSKYSPFFQHCYIPRKTLSNQPPICPVIVLRCSAVLYPLPILG